MANRGLSSCSRSQCIRLCSTPHHSRGHRYWSIPQAVPVRTLQTRAVGLATRVPDFAFAFDIDGVLLRSSVPLPGANKALTHLQSHKIPFILLTNGGGKHEEDRVSELSEKLQVPLDVSMFVQSHTPFAGLVEGPLGYKDKCILVVGGDGDKARAVAERYGFRNVIIPADILNAEPSIWPFETALREQYKAFARPLPRPINPSRPDSSLKIDAIFVFADPRDWGPDTQIIVDALLSEQGVLGSYSKKNNDPSLPNMGFQQDGQPQLYFSNGDLLWAASYPLPRLGQGGYRASLEGVWAALTDGARLNAHIFGKPSFTTYQFAEDRLNAHRKALLQARDTSPLRHVFMVGDNPESDIRGANEYQSPWKSQWSSVLVRSGVYTGGTPAYTPTVVLDGVWDAVQWALDRSGW